MNPIDIAKNLGVQYNVTIRVLDKDTKKLVREHVGHNTATNSLLTGVAHYLIGNGVTNQGTYMLNHYMPKYISLGTMGLASQEQISDDKPYPKDIEVINGSENPETGEPYTDSSIYDEYASHTPGYGADGYSDELNNDRTAFGLGYIYEDYVYTQTSKDAVKCELISDSFPRSKITYKEVIPCGNSEYGKTVDVVFSAFISTGALNQFRNNRDYIFITEVGLWSKPNWGTSSSRYSTNDNGLLAGYRILPTITDYSYDREESDLDLLRKAIIRVEKNQVVQVVWKIQLGSVADLIQSTGLQFATSEEVENYLGGSSNSVLTSDDDIYSTTNSETVIQK